MASKTSFPKSKQKSRLLRKTLLITTIYKHQQKLVSTGFELAIFGLASVLSNHEARLWCEQTLHKIDHLVRSLWGDKKKRMGTVNILS